MRGHRLLLGMLCLLTACSDDDISKAITAQLKANAAAPIDLAVVGPKKPWDRVCVLPPYSNNAGARIILGFPWDAEGKTGINSNEGINVLVFVQGQQVVAYTRHHRGNGDFSRLQPKCLPHSDAKIKPIEDDEGDWIFFVADKK